ncbi:hypothetical protein TNCV_3091351 [Trichonephila clavipes]|uniref:Uncharacterized protein n=1 Tax=Trichonephila clavipes TaxID=2585209 RepID=A0A8X7BGF8_TRICX|nr:hypothetical protein TNCV_3091351 [Trichonephila clavipes]
MSGFEFGEYMSVEQQVLSRGWKKKEVTGPMSPSECPPSKLGWKRAKSYYHLDLESEVNEDDIEELIMGHEDELTIEELQEILNEEHHETQRNVSPSEKRKTKEDQFRHLPLKIF